VRCSCDVVGDFDEAMSLIGTRRKTLVVSLILVSRGELGLTADARIPIPDDVH